MNEFKKIGLSKKIVDVLEELEFTEPSDIQKRTIPLVLSGKDVIGNAATGSGKTLAFASGIIENVVPGKGIQALVLAPTRELAEQISKAIRTFSKNTSLFIQEIYGGVGFERQISGAKKADVIVGTPGRTLDHLQKGNFDFFELKILVLDEADRMVDMGFLPDVEKIIGQCPIKRQTLLFSATSSPDIAYMEKKYMKDPVQVTVEQYVDASKLKQVFYDVQSNQKFSLLVHLLKKEKKGIIMVFCNTRKNVDLLGSNLKKYHINSQAIHGGLDQKKRTRVMDQFRDGEANVLICTDVAARGLDISGVTHVYNYDIPAGSDDYIHRVGRTARAGKEGIAINIVSQRDYDNFRRVMQDDSLEIEQKDVPADMEKTMPNFGDGGYGRGRENSGGDRRGSYRHGDSLGNYHKKGGRSRGGSRGSSGGRSNYGNRGGSGGSRGRSSGGSSYGNRGGSHSNRGGSWGSKGSNYGSGSGRSSGARGSHGGDSRGSGGSGGSSGGSRSGGSGGSSYGNRGISGGSGGSRGRDGRFGGGSRGGSGGGGGRDSRGGRGGSGGSRGRSGGSGGRGGSRGGRNDRRGGGSRGDSGSRKKSGSGRHKSSGRRGR